MAAKADTGSAWSRMTKFVRGQLIVFAVLTVIGVVWMGVVYVKVPAMLGIGRYKVTVELAASGGLYPHSNVSYRGSNIGTVTDVRLTPEGVDAELSLDSGTKIPADVTAAVHSVSAIGEQYIELTPAPDSTTDANLGAGTTIPQDRTSLPAEVGPLLDQADRMVAGLSDTRLQAVIDDAFTTFNGTGPDLARLLDSMHLFLQEANANVGPTKALIDQAGGLLDTQRVDSQAVREWTANMARFTDQLRRSDPHLRRIIEQGPGTIDVANQLFQQLHPTLPLLLANLISVGQVSDTYLPNIEEILVVFPPLIRSLITVATNGPTKYGAMANFVLATADPPACTTGFLPPSQWRSTLATDTPPTPDNLFCKLPQNSPSVVRGKRNAPCENNPDKREPTPELCGNGNYAPLGGDLPPIGPAAPLPNAAPVGPTTGARPYDPVTSEFFGPDGRAYTQPGVAPGGAALTPEDWKAMMIQQQGK